MVLHGLLMRQFHSSPLEVQISTPESCAIWELWGMESYTSGRHLLGLLSPPLPAACLLVFLSANQNKGQEHRLNICGCHVDFCDLLPAGMAQLTSKYCPNWKGLKGRSLSSAPHPPFRQVLRTTHLHGFMCGLMCRAISWPAIKSIASLRKREKKAGTKD